MFLGYLGCIAYQTDAAVTGGTTEQTTTADASGGAASAGAASGGATFTQDDVNRILAEEKRRQKQQSDDAIAKAKQLAADAEKTKQGEFQKLAEEKAARVAELEATTQMASERVTALEAALDGHLKALLKGLPEELRALEPSGDILQRFAWAEKATGAAKKLVSQRSPGSPAGPTGTGGGQQAAAAPDRDAAKRQGIDYSM